MDSFLKNRRGHTNPISIALNISTVILGLTILFFNPTFLPIKGIAFFAAYLVIVQIIQVIAFGSNPIGMILAGVIIISSIVVLKLGLSGTNFVMEHWRLIIISLTALYILRECLD